MPLSNCKKCRTVFSQITSPICPVCLQKEEEDYLLIKQWILNNPGHTVESLSKNTGISRKDILRWIREGRLVMTDASVYVRCRKCDKPIPTGNFCDQCKLNLSLDVRNEIMTINKQKKQIPSEPKGMHYFPPRERERRSKS